MKRVRLEVVSNAVSPETRNARTAVYFNVQIAAAWQKQVPLILETGRLLIEAKKELAHGEFYKMIEGKLPGCKKLPFGTNMAGKLMKIARNPVLSNPENSQYLPPLWDGLYQFSGLPNAANEAMIKDGRIHAELTHKEIDELIEQYRVQELGADKNARPPEEKAHAQASRILEQLTQAIAVVRGVQQKIGEIAEDLEEETIAQIRLGVNELAAESANAAMVVNALPATPKAPSEAEQQIRPENLSMTAQDKLNAAIRQHQAKLDAKFYEEVNEGVRRFLLDTILPRYREEQQWANCIIAARKGIMNKATFNKVRRCLHPDSRASATDKTLAEAFDAFMALEKLLLDEKDFTDKFPILA